MPYSIGVDLGTSSVVAAVCDESGVRLLTLGDRSEATPSAVYLQSDGTLIAGRRAASRSVTNPGRVAREFVRLLGHPEPLDLGGQPHTVSELVSVLLRHVLDRAAAAEGTAPDAVVIAHPVTWGDPERALLTEAAEQAGLPHPIMVSTPVAVAAHWAATSASPADGATVAVYDLGGGTFDAAVLRTSDTGAPEILGAPQGERWLGGVDFDEALLWWIDQRVGGGLSALDATDAADASMLARVRQDCARAKEALSTVPEAFVPVFLPDRHIDVPVGRGELERLVGEQITHTVDALARAVSAAAVPAGELAAVLVVGGSSRMPLVAQRVSETLGRPVAVHTGTEFAVARGAATLADRLTEVRAPTEVGAPAANGAPVKDGPATTPPAQNGKVPDGTWVPRPSAKRTAVTAAHPKPAEPPPPDEPPPPAEPAPPHQPTQSHQPTQPHGRSRRATLLVGVAVVLLALVAALVWLAPWRTPNPGDTSLILTTNTVRSGEPYYAYLYGFAAGEQVRMSWTGPTSGVMAPDTADATGAGRHGPIIERDPPGSYQIVAIGLTSGRTAAAPLQVTPAR